MTRLRLLVSILPALLLLLPVGGCALFRRDDSLGKLSRENYQPYVDEAERELGAGRTQAALELAIDVLELGNLPPETRSQIEFLMERGVAQLIEEYSGPDGDSGELLDLWELDLSPRLRAAAGVAAAEQLLVEGNRVKCVKQLKKVEKEIRSHSERAQAGDVLARAGLSLARDDGHYLLLFSYMTKGIDALEFLVITYPFDPHCAEAYATLAEAYETREKLEFAIANHEDLLVYHGDSQYAVWSEAQLPYLRLKSLSRDDYDRDRMERAKQELEGWLARHPGHELEAFVTQTYLDCMRRLAHGDLIVARYYVRIHQPFGARIHAQRAQAEALEAGDKELSKATRELLAGLPADPAGATTAEAVLLP